MAASDVDATPPRAPLPPALQRMIEAAATIPAWQRTEKEQRLLTLYALQYGEKALTPPRRKRSQRA